MAPIHTYTVPFLMNFQVNYLKSVLKPHIEKFPSTYGNTIGANGWERCNSLLNTIIKDDNISKSIDEKLFEKLVFEIQDHIYLRPLMSNIDASEFIRRNSKHPALNRKLSHALQRGELLMSMRQVANKVILLFKITTYSDGISDEAILTCPCVIDFDNKLFILRTKIGHLNKATGFKVSRIMSIVEDYVSKYFSEYATLAEYNPSVLHKMLFNIFKTESENAEKVIRDNIEFSSEEEVSSKILNFLENDLMISDPSKYVDRVRYTYYQDLSSQLKDSSFYNGFIFAFTFLDRKLTKSVTRNNDKKPVYNKEIYWNLKDLIYQYKELTELSLYWRYDKDNFDKVPNEKDFQFVEVSLKVTNKSLEIHFYNTRDVNRRLKEDYVLHKLDRYLP